MVDLETLGVLPGCKIMTIGATAFNLREGVVDSFYMRVERDNQYGLTEDHETVAWWMSQDEEISEEVFEPSNRCDLKSALWYLSEFIREYSNTDSDGKTTAVIFGNGSDFDNAILQYAYRACKLRPAWEFYNNRCYRTIKNMAPNVELKRKGLLHNAVDDAVSQTEHLIEVLKYLEKSNGSGKENRNEGLLNSFKNLWGAVSKMGR